MQVTGEGKSENFLRLEHHLYGNFMSFEEPGRARLGFTCHGAQRDHRLSSNKVHSQTLSGFSIHTARCIPDVSCTQAGMPCFELGPPLFKGGTQRMTRVTTQ